MHIATRTWPDESGRERELGETETNRRKGRRWKCEKSCVCYRGGRLRNL